MCEIPLANKREIIYNKTMKKYIVILILALLIFVGSYKCPLYNIVGLPCPSCGMTRAWRLALSGKIGAALLMHPLFWLPLSLFVPRLQKTRYLLIIAAIFIAAYIIRMLLLFPGEAPMDYNYNSMIGELFK